MKAGDIVECIINGEKKVGVLAFGESIKISLVQLGNGLFPVENKDIKEASAEQKENYNKFFKLKTNA